MPYGTVNADKMTTSDGVSSSGLYGFKNRIINGAMVIDQRNAGASVSISGSAKFSCDRFETRAVGGGVVSAQRSTTAPAGFINSVLITVTTADSSVASTDDYKTGQIIEGFNISDFGWGTANAAAITVSFWVRSSITGTYVVALQNDAENRSYPATYTINTANTFEYKTVTIAGDTTGTWLTDSGKGVRVNWNLGSGSSYNGTANAWNASDARTVSGATNWIATNGATFYITGVQLEKGSTATSFDYRPYGTELQLCMRYYEKTYEIGTVPGTATSLGVATSGGGSTGSTTSFIGGNGQRFTVPKRTAPTVTVYDLAGNSGVCQRWQLGVSNVNNQNWVTDTPSATVFSGYSGSGSNTSGVNYHYTASAEL